MRVRFLADFDFRPPELKRRSIIVYKRGMELTVRRVCGEAAVAQGKAVEVPVPMRVE